MTSLYFGYYRGAVWFLPGGPIQIRVEDEITISGKLIDRLVSVLLSPLIRKQKILGPIVDPQ